MTGFSCLPGQSDGDVRIGGRAAPPRLDRRLIVLDDGVKARHEGVVKGSMAETRDAPRAMESASRTSERVMVGYRAA